MSTTKACTTCLETLPLSEFYFHSTHQQFTGRCKRCTLRKVKEYSDRPENLLRQKDLHFKRKFGIGLDEYHQMLDEQGGVCAICGSKETRINPRTGKTRLLCVDHSHSTGEIREILCNRCNRILGLVKDNPGLLRSAASYLERHPE